MKVFLKFDDDNADDRESLKEMMQASRMSLALWMIANDVFRPARKHGYSDTELSQLIEANPVISHAISILEQKFFEILEEQSIKLD